MTTRLNNETAYFILSAWCTATKTWHASLGRYDTPSDAKRMAIEQGIYRVVYVCEDRRCNLEVFAIIRED